MKALAPHTRLLALVLLATAGCQEAEPPAPPPEPVRVESSGLGIAVAALLPPFSVASNDEERLALATSDGGELTIQAGPVDTTGINLIESIKERQPYFEGQPGGVFLGNQELVTPIGSAFSARGTYAGDSGEIEETWIYALHPGNSNRLLKLVYRYPPGDSQRRIGELVEVLAEIEAL